MSSYELWTLIISILSLGATIAVSFVIYFLEGRRQRLANEYQKKKELEDKAKDFIQYNISEKEFLPLAQFSSFLNPLHQHSRKIFNEFSRCDIELQKEILKRLNYTDLELEKHNKDTFINKLLNLFEKDCYKLNLFSNSFLYDNRKYFYRGLYDWGNMRINGNIKEDEINKEKSENYFDKDFYNFYEDNYSRFEEHDIWLRLLDFVNLTNTGNKEEYYKRAEHASSFLDKATNKYSYIVPNSFEEFIQMHKIKPMDYYWSLVTECSESECCYIVMEMIRNATLLINRECNMEWKHPFEADYQIERNEDLYYSVIQTLYAVYADKI